MICKTSDLARIFPGKDFSQLDNLIPQKLRWYLLLDKKVHAHKDALYFDRFTINTATGKTEEEPPYSDHSTASTPTGKDEGTGGSSNPFLPPEARAGDTRAHDNGSEPGYHQSMEEAFKYVLQNIHTPLSCNLLLELHSRATGKLTGDQWTQIGKPYGFVGAGLEVYNQNSTGKSKQPTPAAKAEWESEKLIYDLSDPRNLNPWAAGYLACYMPATSKSTFTYQECGWDDLTKPIPPEYADMDRIGWRDANADKQVRRFLTGNALPPMPLFYNSSFRRWLKPNYEADYLITHYATEHLWQALQQTKYNVLISRLGVPTIPKSGFHKWNRPYTEKVLNYYIKTYGTSLAQATNDDEKLLAIVRVIRALEIAHPFADGNQRVFVFLLLNKLLLQNGFLPVILDDPYVFEGYMSAAELVDELKIGFDNFLETVHKPYFGRFISTLPTTQATDKDLLSKLQGDINAAVVQYIHWFGADANKGWFHQHGNDGQRRAREFLRQTIMKKDPKYIWDLIKELVNNKIIRDEKYIPISGTVQAHPHSFISFLLNELRNEPELQDQAKIDPGTWNMITQPHFDFTHNDGVTNTIRMQILNNLRSLRT